MNLPRKSKTVITRHSWTIGEESEPTEAKEFTFGINHATQAMRELGVDTSYDDCYHVKAGEGGQVILYVDIETEATP